MPTKCQQNAQFVYFLHSTYNIQYQYIANYLGGTILFTVHTKIYTSQGKINTIVPFDIKPNKSENANNMALPIVCAFEKYLQR